MSQLDGACQIGNWSTLRAVIGLCGPEIQEKAENHAAYVS